MKKGKLFEDRGASIFSPLIDIVMNLMITFFVFLMIYMAVVIPDKKDKPEWPKWYESNTMNSLYGRFGSNDPGPTGINP